MADLASTDVTVADTVDKRDLGHGALRKNVSISDVTFGDGALKYPTGGVPLPDKSKFGFLKIIDLGVIEADPDNGYCYKYDRTNHTIRIINGGTELTNATAPAEATLRLLFVGE